MICCSYNPRKSILFLGYRNTATFISNMSQLPSTVNAISSLKLLSSQLYFLQVFILPFAISHVWKDCTRKTFYTNRQKKNWLETSHKCANPLESWKKSWASKYLLFFTSYFFVLTLCNVIPQTWLNEHKREIMKPGHLSISYACVTYLFRKFLWRRCNKWSHGWVGW